MAGTGLTPYWVKGPYSNGPIGFGVTARSLDDALRLIKLLGYERYLPDELDDIAVRADVTVADLPPFVPALMGPIAIRGMWWPFIAVGVPRWVEERYYSTPQSTRQIEEDREGT